jgi:signal transduction histidine kinase
MLALQIKEEFVSSVSHELRTPLTSVVGHLEMLTDRDDLPADVVAGIEVVERNAARLQTLVSDLLDVARAREEALSLEHARVDVSALVREAVEAALPVAEASGIALEVDAPDAVTFLVDGDRIRQVLDNLISNGIKYTDEGGSVTVAVTEDAERLSITVRDTGIGISEAEVEQVFTRFFRGGGALQRHVPGTGIGLNIVSTIVAAHGGRVGLDSAPGKGSAFTVELPRQEA